MIEYVNFQNDVRFIADDEDGDCMDIDVKPGVEKVIFGDYYDFFLKLSKKVFPDVKELHISEHAGVISISNEMFPNVRKVTSEKNFYREGSMLLVLRMVPELVLPVAPAATLALVVDP